MTSIQMPMCRSGRPTVIPMISAETATMADSAYVRSNQPITKVIIVASSRLPDNQLQLSRSTTGTSVCLQSNGPVIPRRCYPIRADPLAAFSQPKPSGFDAPAAINSHSAVYQSRQMLRAKSSVF